MCDRFSKGVGITLHPRNHDNYDGCVSSAFQFNDRYIATNIIYYVLKCTMETNEFGHGIAHSALLCANTGNRIDTLALHSGNENIYIETIPMSYKFIVIRAKQLSKTQ